MLSNNFALSDNLTTQFLNFYDDLKINADLKSQLASFPRSEANIDVELSSAAYCGKDSYLKRKWTGLTKGFVATKVIYNKANDT